MGSTMDVDAITRLIIRISPTLADQTFAARGKWSKRPSETDAKLVREYLELVKGLEVLGQYKPVRSIDAAMTAIDQVQQYSLLYSGKLCDYEPASLIILALSVVVRRFREKWKPVVEKGGTGSTTPGVFGAFVEDLGELRERVGALLEALRVPTLM